jgi:hypothetical protein
LRGPPSPSPSDCGPASSEAASVSTSSIEEGLAIIGSPSSSSSAASASETAVYVLHAFQKKTQQTAKMDIELARARYKMIGGKS